MIFFRNKIKSAHAYHLCSRVITVHPHRLLINHKNIHTNIHQCDRIRRGLYECSIPLFALPYFYFSTFPQADICNDTKNRFFTFIIDQLCCYNTVYSPTLFCNDRRFIWRHFSASCVFSEVFWYCLMIIRSNEVKKIELGWIKLLPGISHSTHTLFIGINDSSFNIDKDHVGRLFSKHSKLLFTITKSIMGLFNMSNIRNYSQNCWLALVCYFLGLV